MAADEKWYFTKEQLANTPSRKFGYDADRELSCRQQAANFIQDMGQRLQVSQLCINTAIVYMHRFYVFHSFSHFHRDAMAAAALLLAAKVEEQPRKLEHVIKVSQICLHREKPPPPLDVNSEQYLEQAQDLVFNENVLLQTLGFDVAIDHPHTHVVRCCHLVRASKDLAQTSYFMASNSLHLTTMCLQYKPTVVACFCIHLASKWSNWEIPQSNEGKYWFYYVDRTVTQDLLEQLTAEFLYIFDKCPSRLKRKIMSANQNPSNVPATYQFDKMPPRDNMHEGVSFQTPPDSNKPSSSQASQPSGSGQRTNAREYQEKRERERQLAVQSSSTQQHREGHHRTHHPSHPHPTSAAALLKPHAGVPPHGSKPPHHTTSAAALLKPHAGVPPHGSKPPHPGPQHHRPSLLPHHSRPDHHARTDHQARPNQVRQEHQQRTDRQSRPDHHNQPRPDQIRPDHQQRLEHQRTDGTERHVHPDLRLGGVTAARDQQRREAALQREAFRRESSIMSMPCNIMNNSPAQRTVSGDSGVSCSSASSLTPSSQEWPGFGALPPGLSSSVPPASVPKHPSHQDASHRQFGAQDVKPKLNSSSVDTFSRHRSSLPGADRRPISSSNNSSCSAAGTNSASITGSSVSGSSNVKDISSGKQPIVPYNNLQAPLPASSRHRRPHDNLLNQPPAPREDSSNPPVSLDRKAMQEISERRQLESFFGKTEALERLSEKQLKHPAPSYKEAMNEFDKEIKREFGAPQSHTQPSVVPVPSPVTIKKEKSPPTPRQTNMAPPIRIKAEPTSPTLPSQLNSYKSISSQSTSGKSIRPDIDSESSSETRNGTTNPPLLTPKVERIEPESKGDSMLSSNRPAPLKSSIFSPEKTTPKDRDSPQAPRPAKSSCPSPGIAFGSPPVTPGKSQSSGSRNRSTSSCSETEPVLELTKIDKEPGFENVVRDGRIDMKNSVLGSHHGDDDSPVSSNKAADARISVHTPKIESRPPKAVSTAHINSPLPPGASGLTSPMLSQGRSSCISDDRQPGKSPLCKAPSSVTSSRSLDSRQSAPTPLGDLGAVAFPASEAKDNSTTLVSEELVSVDHHHKSKKKKEKKEKHKHKDKDKDKDKRREEKKHKSKHKEKDKEQRKADPASTDHDQSCNQALPAIKLTIPKKNITPPPAPAPASGGGLKLKINLSQLSNASSVSSSSSSKESRKRDRDRSSPSSEPSLPKVAKLSAGVENPKRGGSSSSGGSSKSGGYARQNGLESRGGGRHGQQPQHYSGSKMASGSSSSKPSDSGKGGSSHTSTS